MSAIQLKMKILFLCTGNSIRSQMAEGWARHLKGDEIEAYSAGIAPCYVHPCAIKVMAEVGIDISHHESKHAYSLRDIDFDYVVTLCGYASEHCPIFPGETKMVHVPFDDPMLLAEEDDTEEEILSHFRRTRDEIRAFVEKLPRVLTEFA